MGSFPETNNFSISFVSLYIIVINIVIVVNIAFTAMTIRVCVLLYFTYTQITLHLAVFAGAKNVISQMLASLAPCQDLYTSDFSFQRFNAGRL